MEQVEVTLPLSLVIKLVRLQEKLSKSLDPEICAISDILDELVSCVEGEA